MDAKDNVTEIGKVSESEGFKLRIKGMSETVSFLGGAAIAGVATVVLLRGIGPGYPIVPPAQPSSVPSVATPSQSTAPNVAAAPVATAPVAAASPAPCSAVPLDDTRKNDLEAIKLHFDQQKLELEKLKYQLQRQDGLIQSMATQAKSGGAQPSVDSAGNPLVPASQPIPVPTTTNQAMNPFFNGLLWATAGVVLSLVGGTFLLGIFAMFSRQQPRHRMPPAYPYSQEGDRPSYRRRHAPSPGEQAPSRQAKYGTYE